MERLPDLPAWEVLSIRKETEAFNALSFVFTIAFLLPVQTYFKPVELPVTGGPLTLYLSKA